MQSEVVEPTVVVLEGRLDRDSVPRIRRRLKQSLVRRDGSNLTLDLARVTHLDTAGLALLVECQRRLTKHSAGLVLVGLHEDLRRQIRLARLDQLFGLDVGAAVR